MMAPAVILAAWMDAGAANHDALMFSFKKFLPLRGGDSLANGLDWVGFQNYVAFCEFKLILAISISATLVIVGGVLVITSSLWAYCSPYPA